MGTGGLGRRKKPKNCADGACALKWNKARQACEGLMNYLRMSGERICGYSYGSEAIYTDPIALSALYTEVFKRHMEEFGESLELAPHEVARAYQDVRKRNYETNRDGLVIPARPTLTLFGEDDDDNGPVCVIYAYWGRNQKADRWLVKIGYTSDELGRYLRSKEHAHAPKLFASKPGNIKDERAEHAKWGRWLAVGREWFYPSQLLFDTLRRDWKCTPEFSSLVDEALRYEP